MALQIIRDSRDISKQKFTDMYSWKQQKEIPSDVSRRNEPVLECLMSRCHLYMFQFNKNYFQNEVENSDSVTFDKENPLNFISDGFASTCGNLAYPVNKAY